MRSPSVLYDIGPPAQAPAWQAAQMWLQLCKQHWWLLTTSLQLSIHAYDCDGMYVSS